MHILILGVCETGKTTLAKQLSSRVWSSGGNVIVYDPYTTDGWHNCGWHGYTVNSKSGLMHMTTVNANTHVFVDEAGELLKKGETWLGTNSRHRGHIVYFIAQRAQMVQRTIRSMCSKLFVFRQSVPDCKCLRDEFACEGLMEAKNLVKGEFLCKFGVTNELKRMRIF